MRRSLVISGTAHAVLMLWGLVAFAARPSEAPSAESLPVEFVSASQFSQLTAGVKLVHVPYRGSAPAIIDLVAGQVQMMFDSPSVLLPHIQSGKIHALAVTSDSRIAQLPEVPTVAEAGFPQLAATLWTGLLAPARTPEAIVAKINAAVNEGLKKPETLDALHKLGVDSKALTPQEFAAFMAAETHKWADVVARAGVKGE